MPTASTNASKHTPGSISELSDKEWARLIKAAPQMLAALKEARLTLECREHTGHVLSLVEAAIAKAEGRDA